MSNTDSVVKLGLWADPEMTKMQWRFAKLRNVRGCESLSLKCRSSKVMWIRLSTRGGAGSYDNLIKLLQSPFDVILGFFRLLCANLRLLWAFPFCFCLRFGEPRKKSQGALPILFASPHYKLFMTPSQALCPTASQMRAIFI